MRRSWHVGVAVLALLAIAGATPGLGQVQPPRTPAAQLEVQQVALSGPPQEWRNGIPSNASLVTVTVRNVGDAPTDGYTIAYEWQATDGSQSWLRGDASTSTDVNRKGPIAKKGDPGDTQTHSVSWRLQPGQEGSGRIRVTLTYGSATASGVGPLFTIAVHDVTVAVPHTNLTLAAQETQFLRLRLENRGNVEETFAFSVTDAKDNARITTDFLPPQRTVAAGGVGHVDLLVTYPFQGDTGNFTTNFTVQADVGFTKLQVKTPRINGTDCCAATGHTFTVTNLLPQAVLGVGGKLTVPVRITNTASPLAQRNDTYDIEVDKYGVEVDDNILGATTDTPLLALAGGESRTINVNLDASGAASGQTFRVPIHVTAHHAGERLVETHVQVRGAVLGVQSLRVHSDFLYSTTHNHPGDNAQATVTVGNTGMEPYETSSVVRATVNLPGQAEKTLILPVPPLGAGATVTLPIAMGHLGAEGDASVMAQWRESANGAGSQVAQANFRPRAYRVEVVAPQAKEGIPGQAVSYQGIGSAFKVFNNGTAGNPQEPLRVTATSTLGRPELTAFSEFQLARGNVSVPLVLHLPLPAGTATSASITLTVAPLNRLDLARKATLTMPIKDKFPPHIQLAALPTHWTLGRLLPILAEVQDNGAVSTVTLEHALGSANATAEPLGHRDNATWSGSLNFTVAGKHRVRLVATDAAGNSAATEGHVVQVADYTPPLLELVAAAPERVNASTVLELRVASEHPLANLTARVGNGNVTTLEVIDGMARLPLSSLDGLVSGTQVILVEAVTVVGSRATLDIPVTAARSAAPQGSDTTTSSAAPSRFLPGLPTAAVLGPLLAMAWGLARKRRVG